MKKRIIALTLAILSVLTFCSCGLGASDEEYDYSYTTTQYYSSEFQYLQETFDYLYEDTTLVISEDGSWKIETPIFLFIKMNIHKGTYTVDEDTGIYTFEGFDYGIPSYGYKTDSGFKVYFLAPAVDHYEEIAAIYFNNK